MASFLIAHVKQWGQRLSKMEPASKWSKAAIIAFPLFLAIDKWPQISSNLSIERFGQMPSLTMLPSMMASPRMTPEAALAQRYAQGCPDHRFVPRLLSADPFMMYIENLLTQEETKHLLALAEPRYKPSAIVGEDGKKTHDSEWRKSVSADVPHDAVMGCIRQRVADFQGFTPVENVEEITVVKYGVGDHVTTHFDWLEELPNPRVSTIFAYVACDDDDDGGPCEGGETNFPNWSDPIPKDWCDKGLVNCDLSPGLHVRPIAGNAVMWWNYDKNGSTIETTWHGGMPVKKGRKAGLNIWTRKGKAPS